MYGGSLDCSQLLVAKLGFCTDTLSKTFAKVKVDRIRSDVHQSACSKDSLKVPCTPLVRFVRFLGAHGRLEIVLQEGILRQSMLAMRINLRKFHG
jgi:hypothetical protein